MNLEQSSLCFVSACYKQKRKKGMIRITYEAFGFNCDTKFFSLLSKTLQESAHSEVVF